MHAFGSEVALHLPASLCVPASEAEMSPQFAQTCVIGARFSRLPYPFGNHRQANGPADPNINRANRDGLGLGLRYRYLVRAAGSEQLPVHVGYPVGPQTKTPGPATEALWGPLSDIKRSLGPTLTANV